MKTNTSEVPFDAETVQVAAAENESSELLLDDLVQAIGRGEWQRYLLRSIVA